MREKMKILIGYDGSESSDAMLKELHRAGLPEEASVLVASVSETFVPVPLSYGGVETSFVNEAISGAAEAIGLARKAADRLGEAFPAWKVEHGGAAGSATGVLIAKAEEWQPDLIIVGSEGHSALGRFFFGSVSQSVMIHAPCSVRIARPSSSERGSDQPARLVVGIDGSEQADRAVSEIISRNWPAGSEVRVVTAMAVLFGGDLQRYDLHKVPPKLMATETYQDEKARLDKITVDAAKRLEDAGFKVSAVVKVGDPKSLLLSEAEDCKADCIFVGATGLGRIGRLLLGSVSSAVAARAQCSVEVVREAKAS